MNPFIMLNFVMSLFLKVGINDVQRATQACQDLSGPSPGPLMGYYCLHKIHLLSLTQGFYKKS